MPSVLPKVFGKGAAQDRRVDCGGRKLTHPGLFLQFFPCLEGLAKLAACPVALRWSDHVA